MNFTWHFISHWIRCKFSLNPLKSNAYVCGVDEKRAVAITRRNVLLLLRLLLILVISRSFISNTDSCVCVHRRVDGSVRWKRRFWFSSRFDSRAIYFCYIFLSICVLVLPILNRYDSAKACNKSRFVSLSLCTCFDACLRIVSASRNCDEHPKWE